MKQIAALPPKAEHGTCVKCGAQFSVAFLDRTQTDGEYVCRDLAACRRRQYRNAKAARPPEKKS
jgi:hypothetical protein